MAVKTPLHWRSLQAKMSTTMTDYVLASATLGSVTQIEQFYNEFLQLGQVYY
jgi:hypothetical protein